MWQEEVAKSVEPLPLNIDYMNRGYFYGGNVGTGHGGRGYYSEPNKITMLNSFPSAELCVIVYPDVEVEYGNGIKGMVVYVSNSTGDTVIFNAQDNRLHMKMQAKDKNGEWRDIEYLPRSWCGNSYHSLRLPENHYWTFTAPVYEGRFNTKLRVELKYVDPTDTVGLDKRRSRWFDWAYRNRRELTIYSNEFDGMVNPAQFWRKPQYYPFGIMDPYLE